jgi:2,4-diaminopentanoate dehydrogenase
VQWTTGNVGRRSVSAIVANPDLELVGCYAFSPEKEGQDVGELCGIDPAGITATNDIEALFALKPDCVVYNPMWQNVDEVIRILAAGINVVSTAGFVTGHSIGADRDRIAEACERGGSTMFGTGMNPGFAELFAILSASICDRVDKISITESGDATLYDSPETELPVGFGRPIDDPELPAMTRQGTAVFEDAIRMIADALGVELDEVRCDAEYAQTTQDVVMNSWTISAGCVAGITGSWKGIVAGRTVVEMTFRWKKGSTLVPDWPLGETYVIEIQGRPTLRITLQPLPPPDFEVGTFADYIILGMIMTAMPAINAIPIVVDAQPGILTYSDLPIPFPRGLVP